MKKMFSMFIGCLIMTNAVAATPAGRGRVSMMSQSDASSRATVSRNQIYSMKSSTGNGASVNTPTTSTGDQTETEEVTEEVVVDKREKERTACMSNNIGVGDTFVWAARSSVGAGYASMVEDTVSPENNACFVKVNIGTDDERIDISDIEAKYFEMGQGITCGSWVSADNMRQRILDAKKKARVWGTVGATVGGAALGVGAMELFGNKLIGGKVEGQKALEGEELWRSQILALEQKDKAAYDNVIAQLSILKQKCVGEYESNEGCVKYKGLFDMVK
jgi:hypothetical protein